MESPVRLVHDIIATQMSASTLQSITKSTVMRVLTESKSLDCIMHLLKTSARAVSVSNTIISSTGMFFWGSTNADYETQEAQLRRTHEGTVINCIMMDVLECVVLPAVCCSSVLHVGHEVPRILRRIFFDDPEFKTFFYTENGAISCTSYYAETVNGCTAVIPPSGASLYFVEMLDRFYSIGGFAKIAKRLRGLIPMTLEELEAYAAVFCVGRFCFTKSFFSRYWNDVFDGFHYRLEGLNTVPSARTDIHAAVRNIVSKLNSCVTVPAYVGNGFMLDADVCVSTMQYGTGSRFAFISFLVV